MSEGEEGAREVPASAPTMGRPQAPASGGGAPASILIVDDNVQNLRLLSRLLAGQGYRVRPVTDGRQALTLARTTSPDLILLDIIMPGLNGYQVCELLKADPLTGDIPIIFLSALSEAKDKVRAFAAGAVDYIAKPFQAGEVLARVATHLSLRTLQRQLEERNAELQRRNAELQAALDTIKTLSGLIPICAWCGRKIEDETGHWVTVEAYIEAHSEATFTHGMCPDCFARMRDSAEQLVRARGEDRRR